MPWEEVDTMSLRLEFVRLAVKQTIEFSQLCRRFNVSRKTGYKWLRRYQRGGEGALGDHSRRPHCTPRRTPPDMEAAVLGLRAQHPRWGGRKLCRVLQRRGYRDVPCPSTITEVLRRHGQLTPSERTARDWQRFEAPAPNELWQMDFKGHFPTAQGRCYPLTILDDHSRYCLALKACNGETRAVVEPNLVETFQRYGMPWAMLVDNGNPWGNSHGGYTGLGVWLLKLGVRVLHSRPYHPQTLGKDERFHRSLKAEVLANQSYQDLPRCQWAFENWRGVYNYQRPHDALGLDVPCEHYRQSSRDYRAPSKDFDYLHTDAQRTVNASGQFSYKNHRFKLSEGFRGETIAVRPTENDGELEIYFRHLRVGKISLHSPQQGVTYVSERV